MAQNKEPTRFVPKVSDSRYYTTVLPQNYFVQHLATHRTTIAEGRNEDSVRQMMAKGWNVPPEELHIVSASFLNKTKREETQMSRRSAAEEPSTRADGWVQHESPEYKALVKAGAKFAKADQPLHPVVPVFTDDESRCAGLLARKGDRHLEDTIRSLRVEAGKLNAAQLGAHVNALTLQGWTTETTAKLFVATGDYAKSKPDPDTLPVFSEDGHLVGFLTSLPKAEKVKVSASKPADEEEEDDEDDDEAEEEEEEEEEED